MGTGSADRVGQLLGRNSVYLNQKDWEAVALSGRGIYSPMGESAVDFRAMGLQGPLLRVKDDGTASFTGQLGGQEVSMMNMFDNDHKFFERMTGKDFRDIPSARIGKTRSEIYDNIKRTPIDNKKVINDRALGYALVATGALKPWAKQMDENVVGRLEKGGIKNGDALTRDAQFVFKENSLLRAAVSQRWRDNVKSGKMTMYQVDQLQKKYFLPE